MGFLKEKFADTSILHLLFLEIESLLYWLVNSLPGTLGFVLRSGVARLLFDTKGGFCWIQPRVTIVESKGLRVGKHFAVNSGTYINAKGGITMGDYVLIGSNVTISSGKHTIDGREPPVFSRPTEAYPIVIEDDVWIGAGAVIVPGITLRKGTVVGANSVVTKSTDAYAVVAGCPAKVLRYRDDSYPHQK